MTDQKLKQSLKQALKQMEEQDSSSPVSDPVQSELSEQLAQIEQKFTDTFQLLKDVEQAQQELNETQKLLEQAKAKQAQLEQEVQSNPAAAYENIQLDVNNPKLAQFSSNLNENLTQATTLIADFEHLIANLGTGHQQIANAVTSSKLDPKAVSQQKIEIIQRYMNSANQLLKQIKSKSLTTSHLLDFVESTNQQIDDIKELRSQAKALDRESPVIKLFQHGAIEIQNLCLELFKDI